MSVKSLPLLHRVCHLIIFRWIRKFRIYFNGLPDAGGKGGVDMHVRKANEPGISRARRARRATN